METINYDLDEMHAVQLEILKKLIAVCEERKLSYFLAFGSLLGAVRTHKIIPWDDSIDVVMPYEDYCRLTTLPQTVWGTPIFLQTCYTDPQFPKYYARLRNSSTTLIESDFTACDMNHGIYINIIPLINLADDPEARKRQMDDAKLYKMMTENAVLPSSKGLLRLYSAFLLSSPVHKKLAKREELKGKIIRYLGQDVKDCFALAGNVSLSLPLPKSWFAEAEKCQFEGITVAIPKGWREWLTLRYGNYMVTPIAELQGDKIAKFITLNTKRPYTEYKGKSYCV